MALTAAERQKRYAARHPARVRAAWAAYAARTKERKAANAAARYRRDRERILRAGREWRANNKDKARAISKRWKAKNADYVKQLHKQWRDRNKGKILTWRAQQKAARRAARIKLTPEEYAEVIALYAKARALTELIGEPYHVDHIKPISKGGLHHPSNLQVLKGIDNLRKGNRT